VSLSLDHEDAQPEIWQKERFAAFSKMFNEGRSFSGHERNCCYLNPGKSTAAMGRFANISAASGLDYPDDARAITLLDWDQDGDLDVWASNRNAPRLRLLRNEIPKSGHFVSLQLVGNGTTTNRDAVGARVEVILSASAPEDSPRSITTLRAGDGFLSQSSKWLHFGLGENEQIANVVVSWPGGQEEIFSEVQVDAQNRLVQGTGIAQSLKTVPRKIELAADTQILPEAGTTNAVRLITPVAMPPLLYQTWDGTNRDLLGESEKPTLVILWASWCMPCLEELKELTQAQEKLRQAGVNIIAISVDGVGDDKTDSENSQRVLKSLKFPFASGRATEDLLFGLQKMHDRQAAIRRPLPLPTSLLLNANDELMVFYKGPLQIPELLSDLAHVEDTATERIAHSASIPGRVLDHKTIRQVQAVAEAEQRFKTAEMFQKNRFWDQAIIQYDQILNLWSTNNNSSLSATHGKRNNAMTDDDHAQKRAQIQSLAYTNRGGIQQRQGKFEAAIEDFEKAVEIKPDNPQLHFTLGQLNQRINKYNDAVMHYANAIKYNPQYSEAYGNRAALYQLQGKNEAAAKDFKQITTLDPHSPHAYRERGKLLFRLGNNAEALKCFSKALGIDPQHVESLANRGSLYTASGEYDLATKDFSAAIKLNPDSPAAYNNFAWLLATCNDPEYRDGKKAVDYATKACKLLKWKSKDTLDTLAAAAAESDDFKNAIKWQKQAVALDPDESNESLRLRLKLYQAGEKYRAANR